MASTVQVKPYNFSELDCYGEKVMMIGNALDLPNNFQWLLSLKL